ncbi:MAG: hypothetical protein ABEH43_09305, partial [Flavobacteriales bacterium]
MDVEEKRNPKFLKETDEMDEPKWFAECLLGHYLDRGFGTMPKRELEILIFHLLTKTVYFRDMNTYELANELKISENRVRKYREDAALRYGEKDADEAMRELAQLFFENQEDVSHTFDGDKIKFEVDDPVLKREFEYAARSANYLTETSFRNRIISIKPHAFVSVFAEVYDDIQDEFNELVKEELEKENDIRQKIDK